MSPHRIHTPLAFSVNQAKEALIMVT
ncbi:hypothetical protein CGLO_14344 [Colletotrichum gloeosporioides Cg-14]|uniref:Uncharacterized protein n=1 Tax=Colletotrichum gloeosporioides (strain Cg-14) TaxID=1237896 RepID=T0JUG3_COLGC|nr:hypothetical protein CGLO_14344 [Colletotrichum gloeosporioides Cg-14]